MNERILKLMRQADYAAPEIALRAQKLAELIVQECVNICVEEAHENSDDDRAMRSIEACAWMIKEHFGVKT